MQAEGEQAAAIHKGWGACKEVTIPLYQAPQQGAASKARMLQILMNSISTQRDHPVLPAKINAAGVSRSTVGREAAEASEAALNQLLEQRFDNVEMLIDSMHLKDLCVLPPWAWLSRAGNMYSVAKVSPRTPRQLEICSTSWAHTASIQLAGVCMLSTAPKLCARLSTRCLELRRRYNAVEISCRNHKLRDELGRLSGEHQLQSVSLRTA